MLQKSWFAPIKLQVSERAYSYDLAGALLTYHKEIVVSLTDPRVCLIVHQL